MPQKFLKFFKHAAHCGRRPRVSFDKQFCVGFSSQLERERSFLRIGHRRPHSFMFAFQFSLILRADPCCIRLWPTPMQKIFLCQSFFHMFKAFQPNFFFLLSQFFNKFSRLFSLFHFSKFSNLSLHDQMLKQIWSQGGGACSGVTPNYLLHFAL